MLHGLEGSSRVGYIAQALRLAKSRGFGAVALNFRSCSGEPNLQARSYSSGDTGDVVFVLDELRRRGIQGPLYGLGFSLGGNVLLRYLGESGARSALACGVAVSPPFDLDRCATTLDSGLGFQLVYRSVFLWSMRRKALGKARRHPSVLDAGRIRRAFTLRAFDDAVTAPLYGFDSATDYYRGCSSGSVLSSVSTPTLILVAEDDPIAPPHAVELPEDSPVTVVRSARGGHLGFVTGGILRPRFWSDEVAFQFFDQARSPG
jgi:predicted alpha/beta-fold hydrolase